MNCKEALSDYKINLEVVENKSIRTIESYMYDLNLYLSYLESNGIDTMEKIHISDVDDFFNVYMETHSPRSANRVLSAIKSFHKFTSLNHPAIQNPVLYFHGFSNGSHLPIYLSVNEIQTILDSFGNSDLDIYQKTILVTLYSCGLRVSELCSLQTKHVHLDQKILKVLGKGNKERIVPISKTAQKVMVNYQKKCRPILLAKNKKEELTTFFFLNHNGEKLTNRGLEYIFKRIEEKTGCFLNLHPHIMR
ncbi:MAG: tyrosine-type recombinase/integrase, partial [Holdemanella sp.]|nr:tyrosine-type recombinase/integrase [Holdemanella sp.]